MQTSAGSAGWVHGDRVHRRDETEELEVQGAIADELRVAPPPLQHCPRAWSRRLGARRRRTALCTAERHGRTRARGAAGKVVRGLIGPERVRPSRTDGPDASDTVKRCGRSELRRTRLCAYQRALSPTPTARSRCSPRARPGR